MGDCHFAVNHDQRKRFGVPENMSDKFPAILFWPNRFAHMYLMMNILYGGYVIVKDTAAEKEWDYEDITDWVFGELLDWIE